MDTSSTPDMQSHLDDEAISAALDGQSTDPVVTHLAGCDRCSARRFQLEAARAAIAEPTQPALDDLSRRRLLSRALDELPATEPAVIRRRWFERPAFAGSAAAAVLVALVAAGVLIGDSGGRDNPSSTAAPALPPAAESYSSESRALQASSTFLGDLGDLSDGNSLRQALADRDISADSEKAATTAKPSRTTGGDAAGASPQTVAAPTPTPAAAADTNASGGATGQYDESLPSTGSATPADADRCASVLEDGPAAGSSLLATGSGTFDGKPVLVVAFARGDRTTAFITDVAGCDVLQRYEF